MVNQVQEQSESVLEYIS